MTGAAAAARLGLKDWGTIRDGNLADLAAFDPATVRSNATYDEPRRFPSKGIDHVIVNVTLVVRDAEHTGATPGRAIRLGVDWTANGSADREVDPQGGRRLLPRLPP